MAISIAPIKTYVVGDRKEVVQDVTLDNSYPTGGYPLTLSQLGCDLFCHEVRAQQGVGGNTFQYDYTNKKLKIWAGTSEVANATDLSALTVRVVACGKGTTVFA